MQDALLGKQTAAGMRAACAPKLSGAAALHRHGADKPVRSWALFSSIAGLIGSSGQANYAAAQCRTGCLGHQPAQPGESPVVSGFAAFLISRPRAAQSGPAAHFRRSAAQQGLLLQAVRTC